MLVDALKADTFFDQLLSTSHESQGPELGDRLPPIEVAYGAQRRPKAAHFTHRLAMLDVSPFGELPKGKDQLVDRHIDDSMTGPGSR
jgi:hypothetical protein